MPAQVPSELVSQVNLVLEWMHYRKLSYKIRRKVLR